MCVYVFAVFYCIGVIAFGTKQPRETTNDYITAKLLQAAD